MTTSRYPRLVALLAGAGACAALVACTSPEKSAESPAAMAAPVATAPAAAPATAQAATAYRRPTEAELAKLTDLQRQVTQHEGTEPPFRNEFWDNHEAGLYVDIVSGEPLFSSRDKFESGTGWPSFTRPVAEKHVFKKTDMTLGMERTEVRSAGAQSHLGHVFDDGPQPTGLRYCINSASLKFIPLAKLEAEGYGAYRSMVTGEGKH